MRAARACACLAAFGLAGCLASSVVAPEQRSANLGAPSLEWRPFSGATLEGLWASASIEGDAGLTLLAVHYLFSPDGSFTGAALVEGDPPEFQTLSGTWTLEGGLLRLGEDAPKARLEEAAGHLRLSGPEGAVVLRREGIL